MASRWPPDGLPMASRSPPLSASSPLLPPPSSGASAADASAPQTELALGAHCNHSLAPNARLERWAAPGHIPLVSGGGDVDNGGGVVLIVANEPIAAGTEVCIHLHRSPTDLLLTSHPPPAHFPPTSQRAQVRIDHTVGRAEHYTPPPCPDERRWRHKRATAPPACGASAVLALFGSEDLDR